MTGQLDHNVEWDWHVAAYLVTKGIAAGAALLAPFAAALHLTGFAREYVPEIVALVFTLATTYLLVVDLGRPKLFLTLLTRPNTKSWLVKGAWILMAFSATVPATIALRFFGFDAAADGLRWINALLGLGVAGYTAFLFAQCEGRDLWQGNLLLPHLIFQALMCGAASLMPFAGDVRVLGPIFVIALCVHVIFARWESLKRHHTDNARQAAAFLPTVRIGGFRPYAIATTLGVWVPLVLVYLALRQDMSVMAPIAAMTAIGGLYLYESAYVRAGQLPPLS